MASQKPEEQAPNESKIPFIDLDAEIGRAKRFKEDMEKGEGWTRRLHVQNEYSSWSKTFDEEDVPVKVLFRMENMPMPAEKFVELMHPSNLEQRAQWDDSIAAFEILEKMANGGCIMHSRIELSFPLSNRGMVLYVSPPCEIDWYGKKAYILFLVNAEHASKPAGADGLIRATNGGNFYIAVPDEEEPGNKCEVLGLSNNRFNGWLPRHDEWLVGRKAPKVFYQVRTNLVKEHNKHLN